jgi:hypothetical protein
MDLMKYVRAQWDRSGAVAAVVFGLVALFLGWLGSSDTGYVAAQMPYIVSGGLLGLFLLGVGAVLWLSADLRDEWRQLRVLGEELRLDNELQARSSNLSASATGGGTG